MILPILDEIERELSLITERDRERTCRRLASMEKSDTSLGVIHSLEARKVWALADKMRGKCAELRLKAETETDSDDESQLLKEQAARFDALEDCARELFWAQCREDIGGKAWTCNSTGIRVGWMFVAATRQPELPGFLAEIMRGKPPEA